MNECKDCEWWIFNEFRFEAKEPWGACHLNPPVLLQRTGTFVWAETAGEEGCSHWKSDGSLERTPNLPKESDAS